MRFKDESVDPSSLKPQLLLALIIAEQVYQEENIELVITSLNDAIHMETSLHYDGGAADLRSYTLSDPPKTAAKIKARLNKHFDVVVESDHIHMEYQRRGR
jgi:hypothetical protein